MKIGQKALWGRVNDYRTFRKKPAPRPGTSGNDKWKELTLLEKEWSRSHV